MQHAVKRWSRNQEQQFFANVSDLLSNGYSLHHALGVMQATCPAIQQDLTVIQQCLNEGQTLAVSLDTYIRPNLQGELALVELHGCQLALLHAISERERQYQQQFKRLQSVIYYPALLLLMLGMVGGYIAMVVSPQLGATLCTIQNYSICAATLIGLGGLWGWYKRQSQLSKYQCLMRIPIIGPIVQLFVQQALYMQLGYLLQSGVGLRDVVEYCQRHTSYWLCELINEPVKNAWEQGETLETGLNQVQYLALEAKLLFMRGNSLAQTGQDLIQLARYLQTRQEQRIQMGVALVQPIFFLCDWCRDCGIVYATVTTNI
ncbi:type II secretion system F family protein [Weissella ceti]|uniref:Type II secretion system F family protein n=1 Tax=Weissella ceti TaxID=759620 RepID=A0ABT3E2Q2_9LACO|nr:type II secretion system F family protein [Weissella ceti]MCW0952683.1 type II secretion system F family protein [Weissella ceti]QVK12385.1 type II secretion system F family protein [Weissella ceti]